MNEPVAQSAPLKEELKWAHLIAPAMQAREQYFENNRHVAGDLNARIDSAYICRLLKLVGLLQAERSEGGSPNTDLEAAGSGGLK